MKQILLYAIVGIAVTLLSLRLVIDMDLWWHLAIGRFIATTQTIPKTDLFSFSLPMYSYVYHSWLTELILYEIYTVFGLWGVSFFYAILTAAGILLLAATIWKKTIRAPVIVAILIATPLFSFIVHARTQAITFFLLCLSLYVIHVATNPKRIHLLLVLPVISLLWANLHGGFTQGLFIIWMLVFIQVFEVKQSPLIWLGCATAATAATIINPYGIQTHIQAIRMATNPVINQLNADWAPLFSGQPASYVFGIIISLLFVTVLTTKKVTRLYALMLSGLFLLTLYSRRFALPLSVLLVPTSIVSIASPLKKLIQQYKTFKPHHLPVIIGIGTLLFIMISHIYITFITMSIAYRSDATYASSTSAFSLPYGAVNYMKTQGVPTRLLNNFNWGGYLIWNIPEQRFFIDGRMDAFFINGTSFAQIYWNVIHMKDNWQQTMETYHINGILGPITPEWPLVSWLKEQQGWYVAYEDNVSILLIKR